MPIAIVRRLLDGLHAIPGNHTFCLHGGEPLLVGKEWFGELLETVSFYNSSHVEDGTVSVTLQTNAILVDEEWVRLFKEGQISVSLSLDGPEDVHDAARVDRRSLGTHAKVLSSIQVLADAGIRLGCIAVATAKTVEQDPREYYDYFKSLPLLNGLDITPYIETGSTPIELAAKRSYEPEPQLLTRFLCELFDLWLLDQDSDKKVDIRMFEQLVGVILDFKPSLCSLMQGASCGRTPSVLPNGDVYACDLDVDIDGLEFKMGSLLVDSIADICSGDRLEDLHSKFSAGMRARGCVTCDVLQYCSLTCPRHTFSNRDHSPYCRMMHEIVGHAKKRLDGVSRSAFSAPIHFD